MTTQEEERQCTLTNKELLEACHKAISDMYTKQRWQMTVPVDFNRDSDMLLAELCKRFENALPDKQGESNEAIENESRRRRDLWVNTVAKELNEPKEKHLHIAGLLYTAFIGGAKWYRDRISQPSLQESGEQKYTL